MRAQSRIHIWKKIKYQLNEYNDLLPERYATAVTFHTHPILTDFIKLNLKSWEYRRLEIDIIMTYKIIHNLVDLPVPPSDFFDFYNSRYDTRRHKFCLQHAKFQSTIQHNFFKNRIVPIWNKLSNDIVSSQTLPIFRNKLKHFDINSVTTLTF